MKPSPLLSGFKLNSISPLNSKFASFVAALLLVSVTNCFCQRSYYEYNNPEAVKINKKLLDQLTESEWKIRDVRWLIRKDTFDYHRGWGTLALQRNGSYSHGYNESTGTWDLKYHRYLVLTDTSQRANNRAISGTFGITSLTDSALVLTQLYTSSRDMSRTLTLVKYDRQAESKYEPRSPTRYQYLLSPTLIDSLTFLSEEVLSLLGYHEKNDTLYISMPRFIGPDTTYKVPLGRNNPLKRVEILHEGVEIEDYAAYRRFTLSSDQVPIVDSLAMKYIRKHRDDYYPQKEITSLNSYFRQYVGYFDINGDPIVLLNAFCQYKNNWDETLVQVGLGGVCYFSININLTEKEAFSFHVNDF